MFAIIMAGGGGTRLWPKSRTHSPKQLHSFISDESLFRETVQRIDKIIPRKNIFIVTNRDYLHKIREQAPGIPPENYVVERQPWGTILGAIIASLKIKKIEKNPTILFCWCDHYIKNKGKFLSLLKIAEKVAVKFNRMVTLGIKPTYPATGLGYIKIDGALAEIRNQKIYKIDRFVEKPNLARAKKYIESFDYLWNSGIFVFTADKILELFEKHMPRHARAVKKVRGVLGKKSEEARLNSAFLRLPAETIDRGISEKTKDIAVIPADIGWSDIGDWRTLKSVLNRQKNGNIVKGNVFTKDTKNSLIYGGSRMVTTLGLDDIIIVDTDDVIFVAKSDKSQEVKDLVEEIKKKGKKEYL